MKRSLVKPFTLVKVVKPAKRALTINEVYSPERLMEILPDGHRWDVSWKEDGIRCQAHKDGGKVVLMSDEARVLPKEKVFPIMREISLRFPRICIADGELQLWLGGINQKHEGLVALLHRKEKPTREQWNGLRYFYWDILYLNGKDLTDRAWYQRNLLLGDWGSRQVRRTKHIIVPEKNVMAAVKKVMSLEGAMVRAVDSTYWQDNLLFKVKKTFDVDVRVVKVEQKIGGAVYTCADREGNIVGRTYKQTYVKAKVGDVIRVNITKVSRRWDKEKGKWMYSWYSPTVARPGKGVAKKAMAMAKRAPKRLDSQATFEEIWKATKKGYVKPGGRNEM